MIENNLTPFKKNTTCAVSGHRVLPRDFDRALLRRDLAGIITSGYDTFLIGMALGFDTECFHAIEDLRSEYPSVRIAAIVPCVGQATYFNRKDTAEYYRMLSVADERAVLAEAYTPRCMLDRNDFLVDNCSLLYSFFRGATGTGTYYTVRKAASERIEIRYYGFSAE